MDRLGLLSGLEKIAHVMRGWGLHPVTRLGRNALKSFLGDLSTTFDGLHMSGSVQHRGHLNYARRGQIEPFMSELFKTRLGLGMIILDIGAHLGYYSLLGARAGARVYSFEPDPRTFRYLVRNIQANGFCDLVVPVPKGVSSRIGKASFFLDNNDTPEQSSLFYKLGGTGRIEIDCIRLDEFLDETVSVDLVKMDVEGAELHALMGMERVISRASRRLTMFIECNAPFLRSAGHSPGLLVDWLRAHGFDVMVIDEQHRRLAPANLSSLESLRSVNLCCTRNG